MPDKSNSDGGFEKKGGYPGGQVPKKGAPPKPTAFVKRPPTPPKPPQR